MSTPKDDKSTHLLLVATAEDGRRIEAPLKNAVATASPLPRSVVVAGLGGRATAAEKSIAIAGTGGVAHAGRESLAYVEGGTAECIGAGGIAISRAGGTARCADILALTLRSGKSIVGGPGVAVAFNEPGHLTATAQASKGGVLVIAYIDDQDQKRYVTALVDGVKILSDVPYKLNSAHQLVRA